MNHVAMGTSIYIVSEAYGVTYSAREIQRCVALADNMNVMMWLNLMAAVVVQRLFPPNVDSPLVQSSNKTSSVEIMENVEEAESAITERITSTLADGFVTLITTLDATVGDVELNKTDEKTAQEEHFFEIIGWFTG